MNYDIERNILPIITIDLPQRFNVFGLRMFIPVILLHNQVQLILFVVKLNLTRAAFLVQHLIKNFVRHIPYVCCEESKSQGEADR